MDVDDLIQQEMDALAAWRAAQKQIPVAAAAAADAKAKYDAALVASQQAQHDYQVANGALWTLANVTEPAARRAYQAALSAVSQAVQPAMALT